MTCARTPDKLALVFALARGQVAIRRRFGRALRRLGRNPGLHGSAHVRRSRLPGSARTRPRCRRGAWPGGGSTRWIAAPNSATEVTKYVSHGCVQESWMQSTRSSIASGMCPPPAAHPDSRPRNSKKRSPWPNSTSASVPLVIQSLGPSPMSRYFRAWSSRRFTLSPCSTSRARVASSSATFFPSSAAATARSRKNGPNC